MRPVCVLLLSISSVASGDIMPCRYEAWPVAVGSQWRRITTMKQDTWDHQHVEITMENDERIIDIDGTLFVQELNSRMTDMEPRPAELPKSNTVQVRYRCATEGPLPIVEGGLTWNGTEIPIKLTPEFEFEYSSSAPTGGWTYRNRVIGRENVTVPAGTFNAWRVDYERIDTPPQKDYSQTVKGSRWYAPGVGLVRSAEHDVVAITKPRGQTVSERIEELTSYHIPSVEEEKKLRNEPTPTLDPSILKANCGRGKAADCYALGDLYREGVGMETDHARALALMQKSCDDKYAPACNEAGVYFLWGGVVPKDVNKASDLFKRACDAGVAQGCANLGSRYFEGQGMPQDKARAIALFTSSCKDGSPAGCLYLGRAYAEGDGVAKDVSKATDYFEQACKAKQGEACSRLSELMQQSDPPRAKQLLEDACSFGWAPACHKIAKMLEPAQAGVSDAGMHAAARYFVGCKYGYAPSCTSLGGMVEEGRGVQRDLSLAAELYDKSCQWHDAQGCFRLASLYERGRGVRRDRERASALYRQACEAKNADACAAAQRLAH